MGTVITIVQIVLGILLSVFILLQSRGAGLGSTFGGGGMSYHSKRGVEKLLFQATVLVAILFVASSIAAVSFTS